MTKKLIACVGLTIITALCGYAQSGSPAGEIRGRILDSSGAVIRNGTVLVTNQNSKRQIIASTNDSGFYRALELPPGTYEVEATAGGFSGQIKAPVPVMVGQSQVVDFELKVGPAASVTVDVTAALPLAETHRSQQSSAIDEDTIRELPMDRRDYLTISALAPGVADAEALADATDFRVVQAAHSGISFHGNNGRGTSVSIDGAEANDSGGGVRPTLNQEAVAEFQINRANYSAEFGGASGGILNIISKSGTRNWHGSAYGFFRTSGLDAADPFSRGLTNTGLTRLKPHSDRQQFGAALGGPLRRDRTFMFASFEGLERDESNAVSVLTDPSIFNPTPQQEAILAGLPAPQAAALRQALTSPQSTRDLFQVNSGVFPFEGRDYKFSTRLDHEWTSLDKIAFRYSNANIDESNPNARALIGASRSINISRLDHTGLLSWTRFVSSTMVNQVHYQFNYNEFHVNTAEEFGPEININGYGFFNRDVLLPSRILGRRHDITNRLSVVLGSHEFKLGGQLLMRENNVESHTFLPGRFAFGSLPGGLVDPALATTSINALQAFNLGLAQSYQQGFGDPNTFSTEPFIGLYVQDRWQVSGNLTLDLGLRYEFDDLRDPTETDTNNFGPRFGFAWDPWQDRKTTVRGGYGIFYGPTSYALAASINPLGEIDGFRQIAQVLTTIQTPGAASAPNIFRTLRAQGVIGVPTPARSITEADLTQFGISISHTGPRPPLSVRFSGAEDFASSYTQQASLGVEREVAGNWLVSANYLFVRGLKIMRARDVNLLPAPLDPVLGIRVWSTPFFKDPLLLQDNMYESSGNSFYHGLTLEASKRLTRNIRVSTNYTLSKAIDEVLDYNSDFQANDQLDLRAERSLSSFDQRHKFVAYAFMTSPLSPGAGLLSDVLGNMTLSPVLRFNSGRPFNLLVGADLNGDRHSTTDRPAGAGRNTGKGPDFWTLDLRLTRNVPLANEGRIELMAEAFNVFNRLNFRSVNNTVGNIAPPFDLQGRRDAGPSDPLGFTSAFEPRRIQFGVRLSL